MLAFGKGPLNVKWQGKTVIEIIIPGKLFRDLTDYFFENRFLDIDLI